MSQAYKVLGQSNPAATTLTALYIAPAATQAVCSTLSICNLGVSTLFRIAIRPAGAEIADQHYVVFDAAINANDSILLTLGVALAATDVVSVYSGTTNVAFSLFGCEIT